MEKILDDISKRQMWVYFSEKECFNNYAYLLSIAPIKEIGIAMIVLTEEQKKDKSLVRLLFRNHTFEEIDRRSGPLYLDVPGKKEGDFEFAIADLKKAIRKDPFIKNSGYLVPIKIFSTF
jgi:hypothetical protein